MIALARFALRFELRRLERRIRLDHFDAELSRRIDALHAALTAIS